MELLNTNSHKKKQQIEIFSQFAQPIESNSSRLVLKYHDFIELITNSRDFYEKFTDHCFNLNQIPKNTFGCIFFALDEQNKGYLTINDWFHFNNLLELDNYHLIILYEFLRKCDPTSQLKTYSYGNKFLSFDSLELDLSNFKNTIKIIQSGVNDTFLNANNLQLNWDDFKWLPLYLKKNNKLTLNSLLSILQNDLKTEKCINGFQNLCCDSSSGNTDLGKTISKNQLIYLLKLLYSHRISADVFGSLNLSNSFLIKSDNNYISYNVFKDIIYLFENFDLINQIILRYAEENSLDENDWKTHILNKKNFMNFINHHYDKINNISEFTPSQINLLFSIVANSKENNFKFKKNNVQNQVNTGNPSAVDDHDSKNYDANYSQCNVYCHKDKYINEYINKEYNKDWLREYSKEYSAEVFNQNYNALMMDLDQSKNIQSSATSLFKFFCDKLFMASPADSTAANIHPLNYLTVEDFLKLVNPNYLNDKVHEMEMSRLKSESLRTNFYFFPIFDSIHNFLLGSIAGCIGATAVYPIDMVKTRMQAQRTNDLYKNSIDCFVKILRREGIKGIYSGLGPQLIGVAPEKAIKLTVNDYMRNTFTDTKTGNIKVYQELLSGAMAGACQVIFTNPLEIVKIRLQVKNEYKGGAGITATSIIRKLGLTGLYKGVLACSLRDIPFSAIYFPTYAHIKKDLFNFDPKDKNKRSKLETWELLTSGSLAGIPSAYLTTPFDVIKTRLQIVPKSGETKYTGIIHAAKTILREESFKSFFKGGGARVLRSSPQFGFTLAAYEIFQNLFPLQQNNSMGSKMDEKMTHDTMSPHSPESSTSQMPSDTSHLKTNYMDYYYKSCNISKVFIDLDYNFAQFNYDVYQKLRDLVRKGNN
ncbi:related to Mitochondrial aspartate-glutamate transporter AGC1 [Saccharomycodes ludwigii]|uniref:Mitochondrial aspartate-glutamate transporter AGC1 n=1 Tax=Saccharomycodes ludwigii TaxID=36035 RepID=A0A376B8W2_9ASCO|nr:related to Mitochondrial aspartate-glutamate transporter AGC1 [Saccharomycodes ludwigii]